MAENYNDVLAQLKAAGLIVEHLETEKFVRCLVSGERGRPGWYKLFKVGNLFVGSYGIWYGAEKTAEKIKLSGFSKQLSKEELAAIKKRQFEDQKKAAELRKAEARLAAARANKVWRKLLVDGFSNYLKKKQIGAHGVKFTLTNALVLPVHDISGRIYGLQFILDSENHKETIKKLDGRNKTFWPRGIEKKGHFFQIGPVSDVVLVCEGYATGASLFEATGFHVVVAFDANNISPTVAALKRKWPNKHYLICCDDDRFSTCRACKEPITLDDNLEICPHCGQEHKRTNAGAKTAELLRLETECKTIFPVFQDNADITQRYFEKREKNSDFNDLHRIDGIQAVRSQIYEALERFGWLDQKATQRQQTDELKPVNSVGELLDRFTLVYGKQGMVFDHQEHIILTLQDVRDVCKNRYIYNGWDEGDRRIVRAENVGFDPSGKDENIICNLYKGWPTQPKKGSCEKLLELLQHMCSGDKNGLDLAVWVTKWLAYPIQNPGAKMRSTLVIHGPQGTGKNLFFEAIMCIYGIYGGVIDQSAVEDKHNDWASRKLFMIADEVVARSDLFHVKNKLKALITGEWIRINPKYLGAYNERNHLNLVFLSNERMPVVIEEDDRRHCVIWTPPKKPPDFYKGVGEELKNGGIAALHEWLLSIDLGDFNEFSAVPTTDAKCELADLCKDSVVRFYESWLNDDLDGISKIPAPSESLYELYSFWCTKQGTRPAPMNRMIDTLSKRPGVIKHRSRFINGLSKALQKTFIDPPLAEEKKPELDNRIWLGECYERFKNAVKNYKGRDYAE